MDDDGVAIAVHHEHGLPQPSAASRPHILQQETTTWRGLHCCGCGQPCLSTWVGTLSLPVRRWGLWRLPDLARLWTALEVAQAGRRPQALGRAHGRAPTGPRKSRARFPQAPTARASVGAACDQGTNGRGRAQRPGRRPHGLNLWTACEGQPWAAPTGFRRGPFSGSALPPVGRDGSADAQNRQRAPPRGRPRARAATRRPPRRAGPDWCRRR